MGPREFSNLGWHCAWRVHLVDSFHSVGAIDDRDGNFRRMNAATVAA